MARMIQNRPCVMCGKGPVQMWTLDNRYTVSVMYLCTEHGEYLNELMRVAGDEAPDKQVPLPDRGKQPSLPVGRRMAPMVPLDWTPPDE